MAQKTETFKVEDMMCDACINTITKTLTNNENIESVKGNTYYVRLNQNGTTKNTIKTFLQKVTAEAITKSGIRINVNGEWKEGTPFVNVNGEWKEGTPYININGIWKEGV